MTEQPRDWDKELAAIDREIEKQGAGPGAPGTPASLPPGAPPPPVPPPAPGAAAPVVRGAAAVTWFWVVLAVLLAAALPLWPYDKACGLQLFFYLGAAALALLAGAAGAVNSWKARRGLAHVLSLAVVVWAGVMGAREVLPRTGYAAESRAWLCPSTPEPAPPAETQPVPPAETQPAPTGP